MKKLIALLAALTLLLCGCESGEEPRNKDIAKTEPTPEAGASVSAQDYYRYINEVFLEDHQLASDAPITTSYKDNTVELYRMGGTGLVSAMIEDFDGDNILEMLTVEINQLAIMDTYWNKVYFEDGAPFDPDVRCFQLLVRHYIYENDQIVEYGAGTLNIMPGNHWGSMVIGIEKIENEYYLFSKMSSENMSTYGPSMYTIYRLGGNGMRPLYTAPFEYARANHTNYLELMGLNNTINPEELSLDDIVIPHYSKSPAEFREALGNRLLCVFDVNCEELDFTHQSVDYTNLRQNLANNGVNWEKIQLPEGYRKELPMASEEVDRIASTVETVAGCEFGEPIVNQEDDVCTVVYSTEAGNELSLRWDGQLTSVNLRSVSSSPDEQWYAIKDALLSQVLGLSAEDQSIFLGNRPNWNDYVNGIQLGAYTIRMFSIQNATFSASLTQ